MSMFPNPMVWPSLSQELSPFLKYCQGLVLNAGSGQREVKLGKRELRLDITLSNQPDILGDLHHIPLLDDAVDTVISIAVLEHTRYPWVVAKEFLRVLRPGGLGVIAVPFLQPQHACPNDYVRFTENGLVELMKYVGFEVLETAHVHHFGQTVGWLLYEYLLSNPPRKWMWPFWSGLIRQLSTGNLFRGTSPNTQNTHYVIVRKPETPMGDDSHYQRALASDDPKTWFYPLLACPHSRQPLYLNSDSLATADGTSRYRLCGSVPELLQLETTSL